VTLGIHRGVYIRRRGTSGVSISCGSAGLAGLGASVTAASALVLAGRTSGSQRVVARASAVTRPVATRLSAVCTAICASVAGRSYLLQCKPIRFE